jgi:hypothetical protein
LVIPLDGPARVAYGETIDVLDLANHVWNAYVDLGIANAALES